jgi:hypothetical protein
MEFTDKKDKVLALAWLLQHNPVEKVAEALSPTRSVAGQPKPTGWEAEEKRAIMYLLKLKEFTPDQVGHFLRGREGTGLSNQQIRDWAGMFKRQSGNGDRRPWWTKQVNAFAGHTRSASWDDAVTAGKDVCDTCKGSGASMDQSGMNPDPRCQACQGTGKLPPHKRGDVMHKLEAEAFKKKLGQQK